jgi:hypothetical protein
MDSRTQETIKAVMKNSQHTYTAISRSSGVSNDIADMVTLARGFQEQAEQLNCKDAWYHCDWIIRKWGDGTDLSGDPNREVSRVMDMLDLHKKLEEHRQFAKTL